MKKHRRPPAKRRAGRGALLLIASLFLASGLLRLGDGTGAAIAKSVASLTQDSPKLPAPAGAPPAACTSPEGMADLLAAIQKRETRVNEREAKLADRMQVLQVAEADIKRNMAALVAAEAKLKGTIAQADTAVEDDLTRLTAVYENMKPKSAAALFEQMDPAFSAGFLGRMRPESAAAIMTGLSPQKAYAVSVILAGRNALVPTK